MGLGIVFTLWNSHRFSNGNSHMGILKFLMDSHGNSHRFFHGNSHRFSHGNSHRFSNRNSHMGILKFLMDSHGNSHGNPVGMGSEIPFPRQPCTWVTSDHLNYSYIVSRNKINLCIGPMNIQRVSVTNVKTRPLLLENGKSVM